MKYFLSLFFFVSPLSATITDTPQELIIPQNETYVLIGSHSYTNQIKINGILYVGGYDGSADSGRLSLISPSINISSTGKILADGRGYGSNTGPGKGINAWHGSGGGYGGIGGQGDSVSGGQVYGSITEPLELGSGGGVSRGSYAGGAGGGLIKLEVGNILRVDGEISANGVGGDYNSQYPSRCGGSGSGGSVYIETDNLEGSGTISANGGQRRDAGGGGGRIGIFYNTKQFNGNILSDGGGGSSSGEKGTISENGEIKSMSPISEASPIAVTQAAETIGSETYLTETLTVQKNSIQNIITTGTLNGTFNFNEFAIIKIKTGVFQGKGIAKGEFSAILDGIDYNGELRGMTFDKEDKTYIKGGVTGDIRGTFEGEIINNQFNGKINFGRLMGQALSGKLYLTGFGGYSQSQDYTAVRLKLKQSNTNGSMSGYYTGHFNSFLSFLRVDDAQNTYNGEGFAISSFITSSGTARGWMYSSKTANNIHTMSGILENPMFSLIQGCFNEGVSPKSFVINLERVDVGLEPEPDLEIKVFGLHTISPGQTLSYEINIFNYGLKSAYNRTLGVQLPLEYDFISASSNVKYSQTFHTIRWPIGEVKAKSIMKFNFQVKSQWGLAPNTKFSITPVITPLDETEEFYNEMEY
ncbi:MAG: hypothetical protein L6420_09530 [Elusimicrobia bacterium]|nr:hypothetical protein [Elusimicrobiota bacterium]